MEPCFQLFDRYGGAVLRRVRGLGRIVDRMAPGAVLGRPAFDNTVIELFRSGQPDETIPCAQIMTDFLEKLAPVYYSGHL